MANFVLVHGAWGGGWYWRRVEAALIAAGHRAHAVTLTGVGERAHLMSPAITLETHIADVTKAIEAEEMRDVVLAVHSYAGMIGTAVADRNPGLLRHLVSQPRRHRPISAFRRPTRRSSDWWIRTTSG